MQEFDHKGFSARVAERLAALNLSPRAASLQAGSNQDLIRGVLRGANKSVRGDHLVGLARALQTSEAWLITGEDADIEPHRKEIGVRFGGIVEAGVFRAESGLDQDAEYRRVPLSPDAHYPAASQFAFAVVGDSMTEAHIHEGMHVLAVETHAWERLHGDMADGRLVVVARQHNGAPERELTIKRLRIFRDRMELQPMSQNPKHTPLVFPNPPRQDEASDATIIAVVLSATWLF